MRENNAILGSSWTISYDAFGNILEKKKYNYSTGTLGTAIESKNYAYSTVGNRDRLSSYGGYALSYDAMGNPTAYMGNALKWTRGRLLSEFGDYKYTYDASGKRISKNIEGAETVFEYDGDRLMSSVKFGQIINFFYDLTGVRGFKYNGSNYFYEKNLQGDITEICDSFGNRLGEYTYDAWGNCTITSGANNSIVINNPFRYRGYYYDTETGLYYCNARYYDPQTGRFISADSTNYLDPNQMNGMNLYAYCINNPVMYSDPSGNVVFSSILIPMAIGFVVGVAIGGGFEIGKQIYANGWNPIDWNWRQIGLSALGGGIAGAISSIPIPGSGFLSYLGTFAIGGGASVVGGLISGSVDSWSSAIIAFGIGGIANVIGRGISDIVKHVKVSKQINIISSKAQNIANMSAKNKSLAIWNMIGTDKFSRNLFKGWGYNQIFDLLMIEATTQLNISTTNNLARYMIYSSLFSSLLSGWF